MVVIYVCMFNINIRCIEMTCTSGLANPAEKFNINIRCIEIDDWECVKTLKIKFNINIRCIEIVQMYYRVTALTRLISTLDVSNYC